MSLIKYILKENSNYELELDKLLLKIEEILYTIKDEEDISFDVEAIYLYGGVLKKGINNTKDIDIFIEVSDYESNSDIIANTTEDFKEYLHEIPDQKYGSDFMFFNNKFIDINFTDYPFEYDFDDHEPRMKLI